MSIIATTRSKVLVIITTMALGSALIGALGLAVFASLNRHAVELSGKLPSLAALSEVRASVAEMRFWSTRALILVSQGQYDKLDGAWSKREAMRERGERGMALLSSMSLEPETQDLVGRFGPAFRRYIQDNKAAWEAMNSHDTARADKIMGDYSARVQAELAEPLQKCIELQLRLGQEWS